MEALLENGWFDEDEAAAVSGSESSVGEDTEAMLYSIVHHRPPAEEDLGSGPSDIDSSFSISKRSKASRWDGVKNTILNHSSSPGRNVVTSSSDFNVTVPDFIEISPVSRNNVLECDLQETAREASRKRSSIRAVLEALAGYPSSPAPSPGKKRKQKQRFASVQHDSPSKYSLDLTKHETENADVIELSTDSDFGSEDSIVVVNPPPKAPPPLVVLEDSSDEMEKSGNSSLIVHCSPSGQQAELPSVGAKQTLETRETVIVRRKKKNKERKKKKKEGREVQGKRGGSLPAWSDIESWTADMVQFYNQDWGWTDLNALNRRMPGHPQHWRILEVDRRGPMRRTGPMARMRCRNCNQLGHIVNRCPDPPKKVLCHMCGNEGHHEPRCPNKICLKCGHPSSLYTVGCAVCSTPTSPPYACATCGNAGHYTYQCPTVWRRLHMITTMGDATQASSEIHYKPSRDQSCCICAKRGHHADECRRNTSVRFIAAAGSPFSKPEFVNSKPVNSNQNIPVPVMNGEKRTKPTRNQRRKGRRIITKQQRAMMEDSPRDRLHHKRFMESYYNYKRIS